MATASLSSSALVIPKRSSSCSHSSSHCFYTSFKPKNPIKIPHPRSTLNRRQASAVRAEFDLSLFERDFEDGDAPPSMPDGGFPDTAEKEEPPCPPGLRKYESMVVARPDMSEDERLAFTQKYEELLVAGGAMYVEVFNRGVIPLAYSIRKKNKAGETNTYLDGIYLLFTYYTRPESISPLGEAMLMDDDVIRSSTFKIRKRNY